MNRVMILSSFDYHEINALFIQKIIEKIEEYNILMHSRSVNVKFNFLKILFQLLLKSLKIEIK